MAAHGIAGCVITKSSPNRLKEAFTGPGTGEFSPNRRNNFYNRLMARSAPIPTKKQCPQKKRKGPLDAGPLSP